MRKLFEMTDAQFEKILNAGNSSPLIAIQCGMPASVQERANNAWSDLGKELGFSHMSVRPDSKGDRYFTAEPKP